MFVSSLYILSLPLLHLLLTALCFLLYLVCPAIHPLSFFFFFFFACQRLLFSLYLYVSPLCSFPLYCMYSQSFPISSLTYPFFFPLSSFFLLFIFSFLFFPHFIYMSLLFGHFPSTVCTLKLSLFPLFLINSSFLSLLFLSFLFFLHFIYMSLFFVYFPSTVCTLNLSQSPFLPIHSSTFSSFSSFIFSSFFTLSIRVCVSSLFISRLLYVLSIFPYLFSYLIIPLSFLLFFLVKCLLLKFYVYLASSFP